MVGGFDAGDPIANLWIVPADVARKLGLGAGGTDDQHFACVADGLHHLRKKFLVRRGMAAADRAGLVMQMARGQMRMQDDLVVARQPDMKDAGLRVVDPDDRVKMGGHAFFLP